MDEIKCEKGATTQEEISEKFDADDTCMKCPNVTYSDGTISCKYACVEGDA